MQSMNLFFTDSTTSLLSLIKTLMSQHFKKIIINCSDKEFKLVKNVVNTFHQRSVHMNEDAMKAVKTVLNKHALKAQDIIKRWDIFRLIIKLKNVKITELQNRITALKTEWEINKAVIKHLRRNMKAVRKKWELLIWASILLTQCQILCSDVELMTELWLTLQCVWCLKIIVENILNKTACNSFWAIIINDTLMLHNVSCKTAHTWDSEFLLYYTKLLLSKYEQLIIYTENKSLWLLL